MLTELERIPGAAEWNLASVQALHRFYARASERHGAMGSPQASGPGGVQGVPPIQVEERVVASWMTWQDREHAIADNIAYVDRVIESVSMTQAVHSLDAVEGSFAPHPVEIVFVGFSQGTAMAYRAGVLGKHRVSGIIALGGDIPPDVRDARDRAWPPLLIGAGATDFWYTSSKVSADVAFLESREIPFEIIRSSAGHEWTDEFRATAGAWLTRVGRTTAASSVQPAR
jgi:predicted esterase